MARIDHALFHADQQALTSMYGTCPDCGGELGLKHANKSTFLACLNYPSCSHTQSLSNNDVSTLKVMQGSHCPSCDAELAVKKGRYGMFIGCTNFPECHFIASKDPANKTDESVPAIACPSCRNGHLVKRQNKYGKFFYACDAYPKCKYMLNAEPLAIACEKCRWPVMQIHGKVPDRNLLCPQPKCQHQQAHPQHE